MIVEVILYFDPLSALTLNPKDLEGEIRNTFYNTITEDSGVWNWVVENYCDDDVVIDSCIECMQEQDMDTICKYITKIDMDTLRFEDFEAEDYLSYKVNVEWDFDAICLAVFHQKLNKGK